MTANVMKTRDEISAAWHAARAITHALPNFGFPTSDRYFAFCVAKDWLQDTGEALLLHRQKDFSADPWAAYIEFWGVLQAIAIQQDAIDQLHYALTGEAKLPKAERPAWKELRDLRHIAVGHPTLQTHQKPHTRCVSGREGKSYVRIPLKVYEESPTPMRILRLGDLLDRYDAEAARELERLHTALKAMLPPKSEGRQRGNENAPA